MSKLFDLSNEEIEVGTPVTKKEIDKLSKALKMKFGPMFTDYLESFGSIDAEGVEIYGSGKKGNLDPIKVATLTNRKYFKNIDDHAVIYETGNGDVYTVDSSDNVYLDNHESKTLTDTGLKFNDFVKDIVSKMDTNAKKEIIVNDDIGLLIKEKNYNDLYRYDIFDFGKKQYVIEILFAISNEGLTKTHIDLYKNIDKMLAKVSKNIFTELKKYVEYLISITDYGDIKLPSKVTMNDFIPTGIMIDSNDNQIVLMFETIYDEEHGVGIGVKSDGALTVGQQGEFY